MVKTGWEPGSPGLVRGSDMGVSPSANPCEPACEQGRGDGSGARQVGRMFRAQLSTPHQIKSPVGTRAWEVRVTPHWSIRKGHPEGSKALGIISWARKPN